MKYPADLYDSFLTSKTSRQWKRLGVKRRAGVLAPLFSLRSKASCGIGEIPDIKLLADWCVKTGHSIIQLLPMNDTGYNFAPYDGKSTFALDPMYLNLRSITGINLPEFEKAITEICGKFSAGKRVDYKVKAGKIKILREMFESIGEFPAQYEDFAVKNHYWLNDYAVFTVLKEKNHDKSWEEWEEKYKLKESGAISDFIRENFDRVNFHIWMQWQLWLQFVEAREYANKKGVFIFGDLPFLVSRDSSDVWSNQHYFKLHLSSGAPPDMYFAMGQRWGMPPYNWEKIEESKYDYLIEKVKYSSNFYDMFRIDHFVGLFRLWTIKNEEPQGTCGLHGIFDPQNEDLWKAHGQKILRQMAEASAMLPCAEDLGVVPVCSYETLEEFGIPGMDVQRWIRDWDNTCDFKLPGTYRKNSIAVISSHDMSPLVLWWESEAGTVDLMLVKKMCEDNNFGYAEVKAKLFDAVISSALRVSWKKEISTPEKVLEALGSPKSKAWMFYNMHRETYDEKGKFLKMTGLAAAEADSTKNFVKSALKASCSARSIFAINLIQDLLSLGGYFNSWDKSDMRANTPGTVSDKNWSVIMPLTLEEMLKMKENKEIAAINRESGRI